MKRIVVGGLVGGLTLFIWGAISHMLLPLGEVGISQMTNEDAVLAAMRANLTQPGLYFFPWGDPGAGGEQQQQWENKVRTGPYGILVYSTSGEPMSPRQLGSELVSDILAALIAALLLSKAAPMLSGFGSRISFLILLGLFTAIDGHSSYWIWYRFPTDYTLALMLNTLIGWTLVGLVLAALIKPAARP